MAIDIKQAYRRVLDEAWGKGNLEVFDEVCDRNYRGHDPIAGDIDLEKSREMCRMYRASFPDLKPTVLASYKDGDTVITQWRCTGTHQGAFMGIEPTGRRCTVEGISVAKFKGGKCVEDWTQWDALGLLRQLGVTTTIQAGEAAYGAGPQPHM